MYLITLHLALERGLPVEYVSPKNTLSECPRCGSKLKDGGGRVLYRSTCGFTGDRDVVACINLFLRYSRCGGLGVPLNAPKGNEAPRLMGGQK